MPETVCVIVDFPRFRPLSEWLSLDNLGNAQEMIVRYLPSLLSMPLYQGITWTPTLKAIPNSPYLSQQLEEGGVGQVLLHCLSRRVTSPVLSTPIGNSGHRVYSGISSYPESFQSVGPL
uniref:Uncharacterized protein n=1 Tax=Sophora flavescens TaxID=49840 RepID=A0A4Y5UYZ9_SOPFL|nr:hypothetical protein FPI08_mgp10 [Sophora flavescens]QDD68263.1 hypothetical protein [Sophora flavescens]